MATHVASHRHFESSDSARPARGADMLRYAVPLGRCLFALIFLKAGLTHFSNETISYAASQGVPLASAAVPVAGVLALAGGLSVALGYKTRFGALLLVLFLVPVTLMMHRFWGLSDPQAAMMQQIMFLKNVSMLGGAILLGYFGAGPLSIDERAPRGEVMRT
jgi:putative oxidoreductase